MIVKFTLKPERRLTFTGNIEITGHRGNANCSLFCQTEKRHKFRATIEVPADGDGVCVARGVDWG